MSNGPKVIVDADMVRYQIGCVCDKDRFLAMDDDKTIGIASTRTELKELVGEEVYANCKIKRQVAADPVENALHSCKLVLENIRNNTNARKMELYLGVSENYRKDISKLLPYKGNRVTKRKFEEMKATGKWPYYFEQYPKKYGMGRPTHFDALTKYMIERYDAVEIDGIEVDDYLSIEQTRAWEWARDKMNPEEALKRNGLVLASIDKDLMQVPGVFFDFRPEDKRKAGVPDWEFITPKQAKLNLWSQAVSGDMTDNIYGIEGVSKEGAEKKLIQAITASIKELNFSDWRYQQYGEWFEKVNKKLEEDKKVKPITKYIVENYSHKEYADEIFNLVYLLRTHKEIDKYVKEEDRTY